MTEQARISNVTAPVCTCPGNPMYVADDCPQHGIAAMGWLPTDSDPADRDGEAF